MLKEFKRIEYDENIENNTIEIRRKFKLKIPDAIIAASALTLNCTLVTGNATDFNKVHDLNLYNPYS